MDVGGTFTKAAAIYSRPLRIVHQVVVPTTHDAPEGVARGVVEALERLLASPALCRFQPRVVAHSTTQAVNALLEGDTATVGIIGMAGEDDRREAEKRTRVGDITLAPGRTLHTIHRFLDTTDGLTRHDVVQAINELVAQGAGAIVASEAFSVDDSANERLVMSAAREQGLPATGGHEVSGAYGLEVRTLTAAINASIMPRMMQTAEMVEGCLGEAGVHSPLVVMRGDGGVMSMQQLRERPLLTVLSGPAASLAGALLYGQVLDGIFLEVGGTSTNLGVIRGGQPAMKYVQVMDHPTCLRSLDVRVQGVAGGSMARVRGKKLADVGPRSAHIAGLAYACFARPEELDGPLTIELFAPRAGDPADYVAVHNAAGKRFALTVTCAANALGRVAEGAYAYAPPEAALQAFAPLGRMLGCSVQAAAERLLDRAADQVAAAVRALCVRISPRPQRPGSGRRRGRCGGAWPGGRGEGGRALGAGRPRRGHFVHRRCHGDGARRGREDAAQPRPGGCGPTGRAGGSAGHQQRRRPGQHPGLHRGPARKGRPPRRGNRQCRPGRRGRARDRRWRGAARSRRGACRRRPTSCWPPGRRGIITCSRRPRARAGPGLSASRWSSWTATAGCASKPRTPKC